MITVTNGQHRHPKKGIGLPAPLKDAGKVVLRSAADPFLDNSLDNQRPSYRRSEGMVRGPQSVRAAIGGLYSAFILFISLFSIPVNFTGRDFDLKVHQLYVMS